MVFENVPVGALPQFLLDLRPFDDLTGLFDPIERNGFDRNGIHDAESTKPYDDGVESGVVLNESDVWNRFLGIGRNVGRFNGPKVRADESYTMWGSDIGDEDSSTGSEPEQPPMFLKPRPYFSSFLATSLRGVPLRTSYKLLNHSGLSQSAWCQ